MIFITQVNKSLLFKFINKRHIETFEVLPTFFTFVLFFNIGFRVGKAILYQKTVIPVNTIKTMISNKNILFALNFPLLTFNFQKY